MKDELKKECISLFKTLKLDAEMALDGRWDTTNEGADGFECQIQLIDEILSKLKN